MRPLKEVKEMGKKIGRGTLICAAALLSISSMTLAASHTEKLDALKAEDLETRKIVLQTMEIATQTRRESAEFKEDVLSKLGLWRGRVARGLMVVSEAQQAMGKVDSLEREIGGLKIDVAIAKRMAAAADMEIQALKKRANSIIARVQKLEEELAKAPAVKLGPNVYKVKKGDSLWRISGYKNIYNDPYQWQKIYQANRERIKDPDLIYVGQHLVVPPKTMHRVLKGENLFEISAYESIYNDPWEWRKIYQANRDKVKDPNVIRPGQLLVIPQE